MSVKYDDLMFNEVMGSIVPLAATSTLINLPEDMLKALSANAKLLREVEERDEPISLELLDNLVLYALQCQANWGDRFSLVKYKHYSNACGCMGPQDGDMECPCRMSALLEVYKYDIALRYLELQTKNV